MVADRDGLIDRLAIAMSGLCLVHCVGSAILLAMLASAGGFLVNPIFHEVGIVIAIVLGALGLGRGVLAHGYMQPALIGGFGLDLMAVSLTLGHGAGEIFLAILGALVLALGHDLNRRALL